MVPKWSQNQLDNFANKTNNNYSEISTEKSDEVYNLDYGDRIAFIFNHYKFEDNIANVQVKNGTLYLQAINKNAKHQNKNDYNDTDNSYIGAKNDDFNSDGDDGIYNDYDKGNSTNKNDSPKIIS